MLVRACCIVLLASSVCELQAASAQVTSGRDALSRRVAGVVSDIGGVGIPSAEVAVIKSGSAVRQVLSAHNGRFFFEAVPAGPISLRVRRIGYESRTIEVQGDVESPALEIVLKPIPAELEEVLVSANDRSRLREFLNNRKQRASFGKFYDQDEIRRRGPVNTSDLFRSVPGITIRSTNSGGNSIRIRGCQPMVWVDGQRVPGAELDEVASPSDIAGIEFYSSIAGTPAQYMERTNRACGTVLVWTKNR